LRDGSDHTLIAPEVIANLGFARGWEVVLQGEATHPLSGNSGSTGLIGNGAFLKSTLREGSLQDKPGPSIATEFGVLLPGPGVSGTGGSVAGIVSQRWSLLTVHFNLAGAVTQEQHGELFVGTILEGPHDWPVRPVAEAFYEKEYGGLRTTSGLLGAIWQAGEKLAFDAAVREARINAHTLTEVRLGVTFAFGIVR
jgi:hypothetical protein